jgi:hypothetical protein
MIHEHGWEWSEGIFQLHIKDLGVAFEALEA